MNEPVEERSKVPKLIVQIHGESRRKWATAASCAAASLPARKPRRWHLGLVLSLIDLS